MSELLKAFKEFHNANYHDGDNHFDDEIYKQSNGDDFDNDFVQDCFDHFEAAWNEQQKKIDKAIDMLESDLSYVEVDKRGNFDFLKMAMIRCIKDNLKALRGEPQKKIPGKAKTQCNHDMSEITVFGDLQRTYVCELCGHKEYEEWVD